MRYLFLTNLLLVGGSVCFSQTVTPASSDVFASVPELVADKGAGEGPAWDPALGLLTSGDGHVMRRDLAGKQSVLLRDAGSNGLLFDRDGSLLICQPKLRRVSRRSTDGQVTVLTDSFNGKKFNTPNDITVDSKGRIYFSDPRYGSRDGMEQLDENSKPIEGVYRIDSDGTVARIITHEVDRPNGVLVTADDRYLFVADNNNNEPGGARKLYRFELRADGTVDLGTQRLIFDWGSTRGPDGMCLDAKGRLYVAAGLNRADRKTEYQFRPTAGVYVFSPEGRPIAFASIPRDEVTNCAFGGSDLKTLFVTAGGSLWSIKTTTQGKTVWPR